MSTLFDQARQEILPMLYLAQTPQVHLNAIVEEQDDVMIVVGRNAMLGRELGFAITRAAIVDGAYRYAIRDSLRHLVFLLETTEIPSVVVLPAPNATRH